MLQAFLDSVLGTIPSVLVVDDDHDVVDVVSEMLADQGFRVIVAYSAVEALQVLQESEGGFDAALVDHGLPDMSGIALAKRIRSRWPLLAIGLLTGFDGEFRCTQDVDVVARKPLDGLALYQMVCGLREMSVQRVVS